MSNGSETDKINNPFSKELAWTVFHQNTDTISQFVENCKKGIIETETEHDLLITLLDIIGKMTDNTIFRSAVLQAMERSADRE